MYDLLVFLLADKFKLEAVCADVSSLRRALQEVVHVHAFEDVNEPHGPELGCEPPRLGKRLLSGKQRNLDQRRL